MQQMMGNRRKSRRVLMSAIERMECRVMLSGSGNSAISLPPAPVMNPIGLTNFLMPDAGGSSTPFGKTPLQVRSAYGLGAVGSSNLNFAGTVGDGTGITIAIIDAYDDPNAQSDLTAFDAFYSLPNPPSFQKLNQSGATSPLPGTDPASPSSTNGTWEQEESLDIEWSHVMAPKANIILYEANDNSQLYTAISAANANSAVNVISMSFGGGQFSGESSYTSSFFNTAGITYLASTGDNGTPAGFPAASTNVVAVGGTALTLSGNSYSSESGWSGSGGGVDSYDTQPSYQSFTVSAKSTTKRTTPDVSILASPNTGVPIYDSWDFGATTPWVPGMEGGTSLAAPLWAGLIADADQGRVLEGLGKMGSLAKTLPRLYDLPASNYHDVTSGNNGLAAGVGYDLVTGIGTPVSNLLVPDLAGAGTVTGRMFADANSNGVFDGTDAPIVNKTVYLDLNNDGVQDNSEPSVNTSSQGIYTFTDQPAGGSVRLATPTLSGFTLSSSASGAITYGATTTVNFVYQYAASQVVFTQQPPATGTVGSPLAPVIVNVENALNATMTSDTSTVTLTLSHGTFSTGLTTASVAAVNGVATFNSLQINAAGSYTLTASDASLTTAVSSSITIGQATPIITWPSPASITFGTPLSNTQLDATANVPGNFVYTPAAGTVLNPGANQSLGVVFTPTDTADYTTANASVNITVTGVTTQPINLTGSSFYLKLDNASPQNLDIWTNSTAAGAPAVVQAFNTVSSITLTSNSAGDSFVADFSAGNIVPSGGLNISGFGPAAGNSLTVIGTGGNDTVTVPGDGNFNLNAQSIAYSIGTIGNVYFAPGSSSQSLNIPSTSVTLAPSVTGNLTVDTFSNITIAAGASLLVPLASSHASRLLIQTGGLNLAGDTTNWTSLLDLSNNDLDVTNGNLPNLNSQVAQGAFTGNGGILGSAAASDSTHLTALGVIQNSNDGTPTGTPLYGNEAPLGLFDGISTTNTDVLIKYVYYGDANLDGVVDGSDYSRVDGAFNTSATGWFNGDFNHDGQINGSDYTLIDNAFNQQGASLQAELAKPSATIAPAAAAPTALPSSSFSTTPIDDEKHRRSILLAIGLTT